MKQASYSVGYTSGNDHDITYVIEPIREDADYYCYMYDGFIAMLLSFRSSLAALSFHSIPKLPIPEVAISGVSMSASLSCLN